jgi:hypothetical protein
LVLRLTAAAAAGFASWSALHPLLLILPQPVRFVVAWLLFTLGPGIAVGGSLTRELHPLERLVVLLGIGSAVTPILIEALGRANSLAAFPYVVGALGGAGLALVWFGPSQAAARTRPADIAAAVALVALAAVTGAIVFWHRLAIGPDGITLYGDYDSVDLSFYAAWASEATHTVPPMASYYSGHHLSAAYYPQLVLAMIGRFAAIPMLPIYFGYAWPAFLSLAALTGYFLVRLLAPVGASLLVMVLTLVAGDLSYLAARFLPHATVQWDYLLWPTNFLSPTMEVLHFNTWTPALPILFTALYAIVRGLQARTSGWMPTSALVLAVLFQFKPFAYAILMAGLLAAALFSGADAAGRRRFAATLMLAAAFATPFLYSVASISPEDRRSRFLFDYFLLPKRMLIKLNLTDTFARLGEQLAPASWLQTPVALFIATVLFLVVGLGIRWAGVSGVWRALHGRTPSDQAAWRLLGWSVIAGVMVPFVLVTDPYVDTLNFYQCGLYLLWIFTGVALASFARRHRVIGRVVIAAAIVVSLPSSLHFLEMKWHERERPIVAELSAGEAEIASYLQTSDPDTTVILHDRPTSPSLIAVVSKRRVVLGWSRQYYAVGSADRARDVNAFFASADSNPADALEVLRRYNITHVVVDARRDRVHPSVLARLRPVMRSSSVTLYGAPPLAEQ